MLARIIDGKKLAESILAEVKNEAEKAGLKPGLVDIVIGKDELSHKFADLKGKAAKKIGFYFEKKSFPENFDPALINKYLQEKNADQKIHGIVIQLPLPEGIKQHLILKVIHPFKDVDCLHPKNLGLLLEGNPVFIPPVVLATLEIIRSTQLFKEETVSYNDNRAKIVIPDLKGIPITIIGAGILVGKPLAAFLMNQRATVTVCSRYTPDLRKHTLSSKVVITGTNQKDILSPNDIQDGSILIDVGKDIDSDLFMAELSSVGKNIYLSKNPGGIGPLTIAYLLQNTLLTAQNSTN